MYSTSPLDALANNLRASRGVAAAALLLGALCLSGCGSDVTAGDGDEPNSLSCPAEPPPLKVVSPACPRDALRCRYESGACRVTYTCSYDGDDIDGEWVASEDDIVCTKPPVDCWSAQEGAVCALVGDWCAVEEDHCYRVDAECMPDHTWALDTTDHDKDDCN
jgi:hypothetical protein